MSLVRNIKSSTGLPNAIDLSWDQPLGFGAGTDEIIVTRTVSHFPVELQNKTYPTKVTDTTPIEIYRASPILGTTTSTSASTLEDTLATFPTLIPLTGRLVRDGNSSVYRIVSNTATELTLDTTDTPASGPYIILADFPQEVKTQQNFETDIRTEVGVGFIKSLVSAVEGSLLLVDFIVDELANLIHVDGAGTRRIIKSNTTNTIFFYDTTTAPVLGSGTFIQNNFNDTQPLPFIDTYLTQSESDSRVGTGLRNDKYYYYTVFSNLINGNVARAEYGAIDSGTPTQTSSISVEDREFGTLLFNYWPTVTRRLDATGDIEDLMQTFGFQFQELYSLIRTYTLQDADNVQVNALPALADQTGLPSVGFAIGADTLRRIAKDMIPCWKIKGSKEGIALFIKKITTWDITNGTADYGSAILDFLPNIEALRFFDPNLGSTNNRITQTSPVVVGGGRFAQSLPGIVIPGFFTFREFVVTISNVALFTGGSEAFTVADGTTTMTDTTATYGAVNSLVGNFILPNEEEINDVFQIVGNTSTTITVRGVINNRNVGGKYAILSPLNTNRFIILNTLLPVYIPFGTKAGFTFT